MAIELQVPAVGESITEVLIAAWLKAPGERVARDEPLVELETDKATVELPAPADGTVLDVQKDDFVTVTPGIRGIWTVIEPITNLYMYHDARSTA